MSSSTHTWKVVEIDGSILKDTNSFHKEIKFKFGFPEYYGMNLDALEECILDLNEPGISRNFRLTKNEELVVRINDASIFMNLNAALFEEFLKIIIDANKHWKESGSYSRILIELI